ncbi:MAG: hypothetical protein AAFP90_07995 [Planctomycetota bacterium]
MLVDTDDGCCDECDGQVQIVDADDATMAVQCLQCGEHYNFEPDAFGDGCMKYYWRIMEDRHLNQGRGGI